MLRRCALVLFGVVVAGCGPDAANQVSPVDSKPSTEEGQLNGAASPHASSSGTLIVDDDKQQCPQATFTSIQLAVNAAQPGATVRVCPGHYLENVTVDRPLTISGAGPDPEQRTGDFTREAVIDPPPGSAFTFTASDITLEGFTLLGDANLVANTGIFVFPTGTGHTIRRNFFFQHDVAIDFILGQPVIEASTIDHNRIENAHEGTAIDFFPPTPAGTSALVTIRENHFIRTNNAVELLQVGGVEVLQNRFERCEVGIGDYASIESVITGNTLVGGFPAYVGILLSTSQSAQVLENDVSLYDYAGGPLLPTGIVVDGGGGHSIRRNHLSENLGDGILLSGTAGNSVSQNHTLENGRDGIRVENGSSGNSLIKNHSFDNGEFDAYDADRPANTWNNNHCDTDSPPGTICGVHE